MGNNTAPEISGNPAYDGTVDAGAHDDVANWFNKRKSSKGGHGKVFHQNPDVSNVKKMCCGKFMGDPCNCEPCPTNSGRKKRVNDL